MNEVYEFTIVDLNYQDFFTGYVSVYDDSTEVNVAIRYTPEQFEEGVVGTVASSKQTAKTKQMKPSSQNGTPPIRGNRRKQMNQNLENGISLYGN